MASRTFKRPCHWRASRASQSTPYGVMASTGGRNADHAWTALSPAPNRSANSKAALNACLSGSIAVDAEHDGLVGWHRIAPAPRYHGTRRMCRGRQAL